MAAAIDSPCQSTCQLQGELCQGCGRLRSEIRQWKGMKRPEKMATVKRANQRLKKLNKAG